MRAVIGLLVAFVLTALLLGCKQGQPGAPADEARQKAEDAILSQQKAQDARLQELQAAMQDLADSAKRREPESPLLDDLTAAEQLAVAAASYAADHKEAETKAALARVEDLLVSARSQAPAAQIIEHLERARVLLATNQSLSDAHDEFGLARSVAYNYTPSTLVPKVPDVFAQIGEDIKSGHGSLAAENVVKAIDELNQDATLRSLRLAYESIVSARSAMDRSAWGVVVAEVEQIRLIIGAIRQVASPAVQEEQKGQKEQKEEAQPEAQPSTAGQQPAGQPPAEKAQTGAAPQQGTGAAAQGAAQPTTQPVAPQKGAAPTETKQPAPAAGAGEASATQ